jgi:hypothetical protein
MAFKRSVLFVAIGASAAFLAGCASSPAPAPSSAPGQAPVANQPTTTEADTASAMEKRFRDAARSYKTVQRDGKTLYCKRERVIGSTIPTMQCFTETQLRSRIEATDELKKNMRRGGGPCVQTGGCSGG